MWAALNGVLVLMAHPMRQRMLRSSVDGLYESTVELVLNGLCDGSPKADVAPKPKKEE